MYLVRVLKFNANNAEVLDNEVYKELNAFCEKNNCRLKFLNKTRLGHTTRPVGIFETVQEKFKVETHTEGSSPAVQVSDNTGELASTDHGIAGTVAEIPAGG